MRVGLLLVAFLGLLAPGSAPAQSPDQEAPPGRRLFVEQFGCSGCHGRSGEGGTGPTLSETGLTLSRFLKQVRLPSDVMPPFSPILASDADLAVVYRWLGGATQVKSPPPVELEVEGFEGASPGSETEVTVAVRSGGGEGGPPPGTPLRLRATLLERDNTPVASRSVAYRLPGSSEWVGAETDDEGRALLGTESGVPAGELVAGGEEGSPVRLRLALPAGNYGFVMEALDWSDPAAPVTLGVGTEVVRLE